MILFITQIVLAYCIATLVVSTLVQVKLVYWRHNLKVGDRVYFKEFKMNEDMEIKAGWTRTNVVKVEYDNLYVEWGEEAHHPIRMSRKYLYPNDEFTKRYCI